MYEIFSDDGISDLQKKVVPRCSPTFKGSSRVKSKSNIGMKKKKVLADVSNIIKQVNPDGKVANHGDQKASKKTNFYENRNSCLENVRNSTLTRKDVGLCEKFIERKLLVSVSSVELSDDVIDNLPTCNGNIGSEISTPALVRNTRIEEDVFFGTHYSQSEDEKELISLNTGHMDSHETMYGYCPELGSCDESCDDRWSCNLWETAEELHSLVDLTGSCRNEAYTKLEDVELTSLFSEVPYAVKTTLDVPDVLFGSDSDGCCEDESCIIPLPNLDW